MLVVNEARYERPRTLADALQARADRGCTVIAGGTDVYPALVGRALPTAVLDLTGVHDLRGMIPSDDHLRIGAMTTWADIVAADLEPGLRALQQVAGLIGAGQVQQAGTIAGNLCTASPAGDGIPVLLALDAQVEVQSVRGPRVLPLDEFVTGYRATALAPDELVTAVLVPHAVGERVSAFEKFGTRTSLVISLAMVAASVVRDPNGQVVSAAVAVGACSPVATRLRSVEQRVSTGAPVTVDQEDLTVLAPIDDIRCSADYRRDLVPELVRRALVACGVEAR